MAYLRVQKIINTSRSFLFLLTATVYATFQKQKNGTREGNTERSIKIHAALQTMVPQGCTVMRIEICLGGLQCKIKKSLFSVSNAKFFYAVSKHIIVHR